MAQLSFQLNYRIISTQQEIAYNYFLIKLFFLYYTKQWKTNHPGRDSVSVRELNAMKYFCNERPLPFGFRRCRCSCGMQKMLILLFCPTQLAQSLPSSQLSPSNWCMA